MVGDAVDESGFGEEPDGDEEPPVEVPPELMFLFGGGTGSGGAGSSGDALQPEASFVKVSSLGSVVQWRREGQNLVCQEEVLCELSPPPDLCGHAARKSCDHAASGGVAGPRCCLAGWQHGV